MEMQDNASKGRYWVLFLISLVAMIALLVIIPAWFWVVLPFVLTYLAAAMGAM